VKKKWKKTILELGIFLKREI